MIFPYKIGQTMNMAINDSMSDVSVRITACTENHHLEGEWVVMGDLTDMDAYVVFQYDESAFSGKIHTESDSASFDYIKRAFNVYV